MVADRIDHFATAVDQVDDAGGQIALLQQIDHLALRQRHLLRRFQHEGVAGDDRERQEPERHHRRKIERGDRRTDAERLADDVAIDPFRDVLERIEDDAPLIFAKRPDVGLQGMVNES